MSTTCLIGLHLFSMCFNMVSIGYNNDLGFLGPYTFIAGIRQASRRSATARFDLDHLHRHPRLEVGGPEAGLLRRHPA